MQIEGKSRNLEEQVGVCSAERRLRPRCEFVQDCNAVSPFSVAPCIQATEGKALKERETNYYDDLSDRLDLILTFTEHGP